MARIRSIKPEFATDGKVKRLPDSTALFFVLLWNHCDDFGFFNFDCLELASKTGRWTSQSVSKMVSLLSRRGLVRVSSMSGVGQVINWEHQRIKDRRVSKWNEMKISWDETKIDAQESEKNGLGVERSGEDRRGKELRKGSKRASPPVPSGPGAHDLIAVYCDRWKERYGTNPPIGKKTAGQLTGFMKDFGPARAEKMISAYLQMPDSWFVTKRHDVSTLLANLNPVAQFLDTGRMVTKAHIKELTEAVDERLGPKPKGIQQILEETGSRKELDQ